MSQQLAQTLLQKKLVSPQAIEEALQRQVVFGGSLDTNLLEAGVVKEPELLLALSATFGSPLASKENIDGIGAHISRLFPLVFAETYHLVPYRLLEHEFWVLLNGAPDEQLFTRIHERLQLKLIPAVTTESRLHYAMHKLYGTALLPRFANLLAKLDGGAAMPSSGDAHVLSWGMASAPISPTRSRGDTKRTMDVRGLLARLDAAADRDSIVEVLLGATLGTFDFAGLFIVQGELVNGWRGTTSEVTQRLVRISIGVEMPSVFQTIYATGGHYLGPLPGNSANTMLLEEMGRESPRAALLAPIQVGGKLAAILYADNGPRGVPSKRVAAVLLLAQRAGMCLEALIRKRKQAAQRLLKQGAESEPHHEIVDDSHVELIPDEATPGESAVAAVQSATDLAPSAPAAAAPPDDQWNDVALEEAAPAAHVEAELDAEHVSEEHLDDEHVAEGAAGAEDDAAAGDDEYVAFADVGESAEEAIDDWEDVLVETAGIDAKAASKKKAAPPSVTWEDVIAEAERAARPPAPVTETISVAGTMVDETELLLDGLDAQDDDTRHSAVEKLFALGTTIDDKLSARFPGRLDFDPLAAETRLPPFKKASGVTELIAARGAAAAGVVLPHLESADPVKRLFAVYFLLTVQYPPAIGALARRLYDTEPRNRYLAADALRSYAREPAYAHIVQGLRDQLKVPMLEAQMATVQVLGQLRDPAAVPSLIPLVVAPKLELAGAAASALAVICGQAFGADVGRWAEWWQQHYNLPRPQWLLESLRHQNPSIVRIAHTELSLLSGKTVPFDPDAPDAAREEAAQAWEAWWASVSRAQAARPAAS